MGVRPVTAPPSAGEVIAAVGGVLSPLTRDATFNVPCPVLPPRLALMVVAPTAIAFAKPAVLIVATPVNDDAHAAVSVTSALVPSVRIATALYCNSSPARRNAGPGPGSSAIDAIGAGSGPPADTVRSTGGAVAGSSKVPATGDCAVTSPAGIVFENVVETLTLNPAPVSNAFAAASCWPITNGIDTGCGPFDTVNRMSSKRPTTAPATASCASTVPAGCKPNTSAHFTPCRSCAMSAVCAASNDIPTTLGTVTEMIVRLTMKT